MFHRAIQLGATVLFTLGGLGGLVHAQDPGSLLVYPMFDNRPGQFTLFAVTNATDGLVNGQATSVTANFVFVDEDCSKTYATEDLTPNDTYSGFVRAINETPNSRGYFFVYASALDDPDTPVVSNSLIGTVIHIDAFNNASYELLPTSYLGMGEALEPTDVNGDGQFGLDGTEYSMSPSSLMFPMFLGQSTFGSSTELVVLSLGATSGSTTVIDLDIYNDNEEVYSAQHQVSNCWSRTRLNLISGIFTAQFLRNFTNDDPGEFVGFPFIEAGWTQLHGQFLVDANGGNVGSPAILGALIRRDSAWSMRPFGLRENPNGLLQR